jgi:phage head maturation protease
MTTIEIRVSDTPWSQFSASDYTPEQYKAACLIDKGTGDPDSKDRYALPVKEPSGALNRNGVHAAAGRLNQVQGISADMRAAAARALIRFYGQLNEEPPDHLRMMAGMSSAEERLVAPIGEVEIRSAEVSQVNFPQRIITVIAAPYEQPAEIFYRGEMWKEVFERGSFNGIETRQRRIPVNREHNPENLVGKVLDAWPDRPDGLVVDIRVSKTARGDETLALADDDAISASVGYGLKRPGDQLLDRLTHTRRIRRAFLDHLSLVGDPAYDGAKILAMRAGERPPPGAPHGCPTPNLNRIAADPLLGWARQKTDV